MYNTPYRPTQGHNLCIKKNHRGAAIVTVTCTLPTIMHPHWGWYRKYGQKYCCIKAMSMLNSHFGCLDRYYYPIPLGI